MSPLKRTKDTCRIINVKNKDVIEFFGLYQNLLMYHLYQTILFYISFEFDIKGMTHIKEFVKTVWEFLDHLYQTILFYISFDS